MKRRDFLKSSAAGVVLGVTPFFNLSCNTGPHKLDKVGLQMYTLGFSVDDIEATLEQLKEAGYDQVEFAGAYYDKTAQEMKEILDRIGLTSPANHARNLTSEDGLKQSIENAQIIGHEYLIMPTPPRGVSIWGARPPDAIQPPQGGQPPQGSSSGTGGPSEGERPQQEPEPPPPARETIMEHVETFNRIGEACREAGLRFAYHNHQGEFVEVEGGGIVYDIYLEETDPDLVSFEMDLGWAIAAGADPLAYFEKYPGRFHLFHVKDIDENQNPCVVGEGTIDFAPIFARSQQAGVKYYIVEQDAAPDPMANVTDSVRYLKGMTF